MKSTSAVLLLVSLATTLAVWQADPPYYAVHYDDIGDVRGLFVDPAGDLLALSQGSSGVECYYETSNLDGSVDVNRVKIVNGNGLGLNHAVTFHNGYIYASSDTTVYRWPYTPGSRTLIGTAAQRVVEGMPAGGHSSRTLIFDQAGRLYVSVGSDGNVDQTSIRSRILRFDLVGLLPISWAVGTLFADGLRNEAGLAFDSNGVLHGVENGADNLRHPVYGDIHNTNPAEEFNRFDQPLGTHYGYPYCFSTHNLEDFAAGTQFSWPSFTGDGTHTDDWCKDVTNNRPPLIAMPAHNAPLGVEFYSGEGCGGGAGAFPCNFTGHAVVAFHGSWNANPPVGYRVSRFPFNDGTPTMEDINIVYDNKQGGNFRPVNAVFSKQGHLFISADSNNLILKVTYGVPPSPIRRVNVHV